MKNKDKKKHTIDTADARKRVAELVRYLLDEDLSTELHDKLRGWFAGAEEGGIIEQAVLTAAGREARPNEQPDAEEYRSLCEVLKRLGLEERYPVGAPPKRKLPIGRIALRVASVLIPFIVILGAGYFAGWFAGDDPHAGTQPDPDTVAETIVIVEAIPGVQKNVVLADNTVIWVNGGSSVSFPEEFADDQRHVRLEGEAFFEVSGDEDRPFVVHTDALEVRVLGTAFNVSENALLGVTEVALYAGSVEVAAGGKISRLDPMHRLRYDHATDRISVERLVAGETPDWRTDVIYTDTCSLPELFRMIGNYYDVDIVFDEMDFADSDLYKTAFGKGQTAEKVIYSLSVISGEFSFRSGGGRIIIERNR